MPGRRNPYAKPDAFTRAAKQKGFAARSVFKLEEIDRRVRLFAASQRVLDLGAAPGSWSQYAAERIGRGGKLLAIDRNPMHAFACACELVVRQGDALSIANEDLATFAPYDVVMSDMAPDTTGQKDVDQARSLELFLAAVRVATALGAPKSAFVGKLFMGPEFARAKEALAEWGEVKVVRPEATRAVSTEVFLVGLRKR